MSGAGKSRISLVKALLLKYRRALLPLFVALIFDLSLLAINYALALKLEESAALINVAGRQRMLSQRISKSVTQVYYQVSLGLPYGASIDELAHSVHLFNRTLSAFIHGGKTTAASGAALSLSPIAVAGSADTLNRAEALWLPIYKRLSQNLLGAVELGELEPLVSLLIQHNSQLLELMNDLTVQLEQDAASNTRILRWLQACIVLLVLLLFGLALLRLYRAENYYSTLMEASTDIVMSVNVASGRVSFISKSVEHILDCPVEYYLRNPVDRLFTRSAAEEFRELLDSVRSGQPLHHNRDESELIKGDGSILTVDCVMQLSRDQRGQPSELLVDVRDITERKQYEMKLKELAHRDALTGLPNRNLFFDFSRQAISRAERQGSGMAILFIDLDYFKEINDRYGHDTGDRFLQHVADRLIKCFRQSDTICRLGGDEFVVLVEQVAEPEALQPLCQKVIDCLSAEIEIEGAPCRVGVSVGVAVYPRDGRELADLLNRADEAMYSVKQSGKGSFAFARAVRRP